MKTMVKQVLFGTAITMGLFLNANSSHAQVGNDKKTPQQCSDQYDQCMADARAKRDAAKEAARKAYQAALNKAHAEYHRCLDTWPQHICEDWRAEKEGKANEEWEAADDAADKEFAKDSAACDTQKEDCNCKNQEHPDNCDE